MKSNPTMLMLAVVGLVAVPATAALVGLYHLGKTFQSGLAFFIDILSLSP